MERAVAVPVEREQQKRRGDSVADAGLDRDLRAKLTRQRVEPQALVVAVPARDPPGVVAVASLRFALNRVPEERGLLLEMVDEPALADLFVKRGERYFFGRPSSTPVGR